jgi:galactoside O-acetyltransferase
MTNKKKTDFEEWMEQNPEARAFSAMREGQPVSLGLIVSLGLKNLFRDPFLAFLRNYPGGVGIKLREWFYKGQLKKCGTCVILDEGVRIDDPSRIAISDYVWVDKNVQLFAGWGSIDIGRRVHIAPDVLISGCGHVMIEDYAAVARGASIYSHSEAIVGGKRLSGPMIPEMMKGMKTSPIRICKDVVVGINSVVLPGVTIGEGAIVGANSMVNKDVPSWHIVLGNPAKKMAVRPKVTVEDI